MGPKGLIDGHLSSHAIAGVILFPCGKESDLTRPAAEEQDELLWQGLFGLAPRRDCRVSLPDYCRNPKGRQAQESHVTAIIVTRLCGSDPPLHGFCKAKPRGRTGITRYAHPGELGLSSSAV